MEKKKRNILQPTNCYQSGRSPNLKASDLVFSFLHVAPEGHMTVTLASWPSRRRSVPDKRQMLFFLPLRLISSKTRRHRPPMTWKKHPAVPPSVAAAVSESLLGDTASI